ENTAFLSIACSPCAPNVDYIVDGGNFIANRDVEIHFGVEIETLRSNAAGAITLPVRFDSSAASLRVEGYQFTGKAENSGRFTLLASLDVSVELPVLEPPEEPSAPT